MIIKTGLYSVRVVRRPNCANESSQIRADLGAYIRRHTQTPWSPLWLRHCCPLLKPGLHSVRGRSTQTELHKRIYADTRVMAFIRHADLIRRHNTQRRFAYHFREMYFILFDMPRKSLHIGRGCMRAISQ